MNEMSSLFALADKVVTPEEKQQLFSELAEKESFSAGLVNWDGTQGADVNVRRTDITTLEDDHWLSIRMREKIEQLNNQLWGMSISTVERLQVLDYTQKGHYVWHFDVLPADVAEDSEAWKGTNRILTAVLNLTDESDYAMGDLMLHDPVSGSRSPGFHGCGAMVVFPSNHWHRATSVTSGFRRVVVMWLRGRMDDQSNAYIADFTRSMHQTSPSPVVNAATGPIGIPDDDGLLVYRPYTNHMYALDGIAGWIWEALAQKIPPQTVIEDLANNFSQSVETVASDVESLKQQWTAENIFPDETATLINPEINSPAASSQLYHMAGALLQIDYNDTEVEHLLKPLLKPLESSHQDSPVRLITVTAEGGRHYIRIDQGMYGVMLTASRAVNSILSELQSLALAYGGASLMFGAGAIAVADRAVVFPEILSPGRTALLYALAKKYEVNFLANSTLPFYRSNSTVEAMPLPLKLRQLDIELLQNHMHIELPDDWNGTESDRFKLIAAPATNQNDGRRYHPGMLVFARYDAENEPTLTQISSIQGLSRLMASGSYFVQGASYQDVLQISRKIKSVPVYELNFSDINSALILLEPILFADTHHNNV